MERMCGSWWCGTQTMGGASFENIAVRHPQKPCLFSETCSAVDAHSRCAKGSCECLQGHEVHHVGACRRWASYDQQCDNKVHCLEDGVECVDGVCMCDRGRLRFNGTCQVVDEGLGSLNVRQVLNCTSKAKMGALSARDVLSPKKQYR